MRAGGFEALLHFVVLVVVMLFPATVPGARLVSRARISTSRQRSSRSTSRSSGRSPESRDPVPQRSPSVSPRYTWSTCAAANALPLVAACAMPNESTGTELKATTDMNFRSTCSLPLVLFCWSTDDSHPLQIRIERLLPISSFFGGVSLSQPNDKCLLNVGVQ